MAQKTSPSSPPKGKSRGRAAALPATRQLSVSNISNDVVERALLSGEQSGLLEDLFGPAQYGELRRLAQRAESRMVRGGPRVLILPGLMGSKLGHPADLLFDDVLWIDPVDVALGRLRELALSKKKSNVKALGVVLFAYLPLKLRLRAAGLDADFHFYDWRLSLANLGKELAERLKREPGQGPVHLVAHSMGGMVARAALAHNPQRLGRVVMLGTPNHGSFSPIQAFRGVHSLVRKLDFLDPWHSGEDLARKVFGTFPGLCELLPTKEVFQTDYFNLASWPSQGVHPAATILAAAKKVSSTLPRSFAAHKELVIVAGVERETVVDADVNGNEFVYRTSWAGDGTVPLSSARLQGANHVYYIEEDHGALAGNRDIAKALPEIIETGKSSLLSDDYEPRRTRPGRKLPEPEMRSAPYEGTPGRTLSLREQRHILEGFVSPDEKPGTDVGIEDVPGNLPRGPGAAPETLDLSTRIVIGRQKNRRLDITLAFGSITEVDSSAYVLGVFRNIRPSGAANALDERLGGAITDMVARRMFNGNVGEISVIPTGRHPVRANAIAFAGMGAVDRFSAESLRVIAENLVRTFVSTGIDDFAIVPLGGGTNVFTYEALESLFVGFIRGLEDSDTDHRFRSITICEVDEQRFKGLREGLYRLATSSICDDVEVTLREARLPEPAAVGRVHRAAPSPDSVYLLVREEAVPDTTANVAQDNTLLLGSSVLTTGSKATVFKGRKEVGTSELDQLLAVIRSSAFDNQMLPDFGKTLAELILPESVRAILARYTADPLVVVHDAAASRIPWETISIDGKAPALQGGLSHRYEAENLSVAKWLHERQQDPVLDVLLVINPTEDLAGAAEEGRKVAARLSEFGARVKVTRLEGGEARKERLLREFDSGKYDVVHYAGHAFFDPLSPSSSGLLCAHHEVLSGGDLVSLSQLPSLVFFNACEAARVRGAKEQKAEQAALTVRKRVQRNVSFAEAFLRGGVANFLGTYWPVGDSAAEVFARILYAELLEGRPLGHALMDGRRALYNIGEVDWADYVLYGDPNFVLKWPQSGASGHVAKRDLNPPTWVVCHGPDGTPDGTPVSLDGRPNKLRTGVQGMVDVASHAFSLVHDGKTYATREYCEARSPSDPKEIHIDQET